jgi:hypothetical protein
MEYRNTKIKDKKGITMGKSDGWWVTIFLEYSTHNKIEIKYFGI